MDKIVVITIIAVFWLFGLLTAWSMCVVAARADPTYGREPPRPPTDSNAPAGTPKLDGSGADYKNKIHMISLRFK